MPDPAPAGSAGTAVSPLPIHHLSWSSIQTFAQCPRKYEYRYLLQAPEERVSAALVFGSAFHRAAVELVHEARLAGQTTPPISQLMAAYDRAWSEGADGKPEVTFCKGEDRNAQRELAQRMLESYMEHISNEKKGEVLAVEEEVLFQLLPDAPPIRARLDLVELQGSDVVISDLKTSRCRWNEAKVRENLPQLITYAHAAMPILRAVGATKVKPQFIIITKGKRKAVVQVEQPVASQDDVVRLKDLVRETWNAIRAGAYPRRESWACHACAYRMACLGR